MTNPAKYTKQKIEGSKAIIADVTSLAGTEGYQVSICYWQRSIYMGGPHTLVLESGAKQVTGQFEDEWLANYNGFGMEHPAKLVVWEMVSRLRDS